MNWKQALDRLAMHTGYTVMAIVLLLDLFGGFLRAMRFFLGGG